MLLGELLHAGSLAVGAHHLEVSLVRSAPVMRVPLPSVATMFLLESSIEHIIDHQVR